LQIGGLRLRPIRRAGCHAPEPGAGLSGAPPTETGPTGLGIGGGIGAVALRDVRTIRVRAFELGMLEVVIGSMGVIIGLLKVGIGSLEVVLGMLEVVKVTAPRRVSTCTVSKVTWRDILFNSACWAAEFSSSEANTAALCRCDTWISVSAARMTGSGIAGGAVFCGGCAATRLGQEKFGKEKSGQEKLGQEKSEDK
jgi:hypothetical protein